MSPINVESDVLLFWNLLSILVIVYNFVETPMVIFIINYAYKDPYYTYEFIYADIAMLLMFLADIVLVRWRVSFYHLEINQLNYIPIYQRYFRRFFIFDLVAFLGFMVFIILKDYIYIKLVIFLKIVLLL